MLYYEAYMIAKSEDFLNRKVNRKTLLLYNFKNMSRNPQHSDIYKTRLYFGLVKMMKAECVE